MKNIITALDNTEISKALQKENNLEIISKDISYKEGIIEQLEKNKKVDLVIINENIDGDIEINELIRKIKEKVRNIEIIIITTDKNKILKEINRFKKIELYETNKIKIKKLISLINSNTSNIKKNNKINNNIICISGTEGVGKSVTSIIFSKLSFSSNNLLIEFNSNLNQDISTIFNIEDRNDIQKLDKKIKFISTNKILKVENIFNKNNYENIIIDLGNKIENKDKIKLLESSQKIIILLEPNLLGLKKCKNILYYYINELKIKKESFVLLINNKAKDSIDKKIIKNIFKEIKIIGEINNIDKYNKLINNKFKNINLIIDKKEMKNIKSIIKKL